METFRRIRKILSTIVVVIAVALAIALVGVRLIGLDVYTVLSGSMEPTYKTGSVIWVADREPEEIEVGDPITFVMNEDLVVATHRVIEIDAENQYFYTQGDANDAPDGSPVHFENLIGEPVLTVPCLGYLVNYVQSPPGCYIAITVCALIVMLTFLPDLFAKDEEEEEIERKRQAAASGSRAQRQTSANGSQASRRQPASSQQRRPQPARSVQPATRSASQIARSANANGARSVRQASATTSQQRQPQAGQRPVRPQVQQARPQQVRPQQVQARPHQVRPQQAQPRPQAQQRAQVREGAERSNNPRLRNLPQIDKR